MSRLVIAASLPEGTSSSFADSANSVGTNTGTNGLAVIVLGVHRSGTSALAGALTALGFHPGDKLLPAVASVNNSGFFEDQRVVDLNDQLLAAAGRDWNWPGPLPAGWQNKTAVKALQPAINAYIEAQKHHTSWLLKDPRLCQLLPIWLDAFAESGITPRVLLSYRPVTEVSHSLQARDNLAATLAEQLWVAHLLSSEQLSRNQQRLLIGYNTLVEDSTTTIEQIASWLDIAPTEQQLAQASTFVSAGQRHQRASELSAAGLPLASDVNAVFAALTQTNTPINADVLASPKLRKQLDEFNTRAAAGLSDLQPVIDAQAQSFRQLETNFAKAMQQIRSLNDAADAHQENAALSADAARQQYQGLTQAVEQITELKKSLDSEIESHASFRERATRVLGDLVLPPAQSVAREQNSNDYKGVINLQVENNSHTRVIRYLREHLQTKPALVLEIGCSEGYFGAALKDDGHIVWGIETNAIAAASAESVLDLVFRDSIEAFLLAEEHLDTRFDAIIFGDVLEHLLDPARILREVSSRLTPGGVIVASVPNVAHERVRMMLLEGRWEYTPTGIMDNTHLHFFTRDTLVELFNAANLNIKRFSPIILEGDAVQINVDPRTLSRFEEHITDRERNIFQFIVMVEPSPAGTHAAAVAHNEVFRLRKQHRILCLPPLATSSLYSIRIGDPLERQNQLYGGETRIAPYGAPSDADLDWADTIVLQREASDEQVALVERLQALGKRVIFDIDDYLIEVPTYLSVHQHCVNMRPSLEAMLKAVDAVSVSTAPLQNKLLAYNPNVFVTPNCAWSSHPPITHSAQPADNAEPVRIIVASSDSVRVDFLVAALQEIVANENIELIGIGPPGDFLREVGLPLDTAPLMPHEQFKAYIASRNNTIALIPLDDNEFNNCKSAIKYFDYALAGVPCICSGVEPYTTALEHEVSGLLCPPDTATWVAAITSLVRNPQLRQSLATNARDRVSDAHNLNLTAAAWQDVFQAIDFPDGDPLYAELSDNRPEAAKAAPELAEPLATRTRGQLLRGTLRHLLQPASWQSAWQIYKNEGFAGLQKKWKLVF